MCYISAQEIFRDVGRILKDRRESDDLYNIYSYVDNSDDDPAAKDEDLEKKLSNNGTIAKEKLDRVSVLSYFCIITIFSRLGSLHNSNFLFFM